MAVRAMWKGVIRFGEVRLPVKLYSAAVDRNIHFHLLHDQDFVRLRQRMVNSVTEEEIPLAEARKGYEVERNLFVKLDEEELEDLEPEESRDITITQFVPRGRLRHPWYLRPYWLGPDDNDDDYFALARALHVEDREGIAQWVMRKKAYIGSLQAVGDYLMLVTLRHADEVISVNELKPPPGRQPEAKERKLAEQLIDTLADKFDAGDYRDEYRERVLDLIEIKQQGGEIELEEYEEEPEPESLSAALEASLEK